jgi:ribosomal protein L7Ae-like RNA K-turn-binding protein
VTDNLFRAVGLAAKAHRLTFGCELTCEGIKERKVKLVILLEAAAKNCEKKIKRYCEEYGTELYVVSAHPDALAGAVGKKKALMTLGVTDENLSVLIRQNLCRKDGKSLTVSESEV